MTELIAALVGALISGAVTYRVTQRQITAEAGARDDARRDSREDRIREAAQVALAAVANVLLNADELPGAWAEYSDVTMIDLGPDEVRSTRFMPRAWLAQRHAAEAAIEAMRAVGTSTAVELRPVGLYERVWEVSRLVDDYSRLDGHDAQTDFTEYAAYVYRSLGAYLTGDEIPTEAEPPLLDGTWRAPDRVEHET